MMRPLHVPRNAVLAAWGLCMTCVVRGCGGGARFALRLWPCDGTGGDALPLASAGSPLPAPSFASPPATVNATVAALRRLFWAVCRGDLSPSGALLRRGGGGGDDVGDNDDDDDEDDDNNTAAAGVVLFVRRGGGRGSGERSATSSSTSFSGCSSTSSTCSITTTSAARTAECSSSGSSAKRQRATHPSAPGVGAAAVRNTEQAGAPQASALVAVTVRWQRSGGTTASTSGGGGGGGGDDDDDGGFGGGDGAQWVHVFALRPRVGRRCAPPASIESKPFIESRRSRCTGHTRTRHTLRHTH